MCCVCFDGMAFSTASIEFYVWNANGCAWLRLLNIDHHWKIKIIHTSKISNLSIFTCLVETNGVEISTAVGVLE